jgi:hypothetical protein
MPHNGALDATQPSKVRKPAGKDSAKWLREESQATLSTTDSVCLMIFFSLFSEAVS